MTDSKVMPKNDSTRMRTIIRKIILNIGDLCVYDNPYSQI